MTPQDWCQTLWAFLGTAGIAVLFQIRGLNVALVSLGAGLGWIAFRMAASSGMPVPYAAFTATLVIGLFAEVMARIRKSPATVSSVPGVVPLVPGAGMYDTMFEWLRGREEVAIRIGIATLGTACAIAIGIAFVSATARIASSRMRSRRSA